ncbi:hypothetical protein HID58_008807, partial [Brassica napus]
KQPGDEEEEEEEEKKMMSDRSELRVHLRRSFDIMIKTSYRWICNHPFLLGFVAFLYLLHRTCPLLFSALVVASPVLVCTLVLLGTILSFGEPNVPEIEKEKPETVYEAAPFRTEVSRDPFSTVVVERGGGGGGESFNVERFLGREKEEEDVVLDGKDVADGLVENLLSEVDDDGRPFDYRPLVDETLDEVKRGGTHVRFEERAFVVDVDKKRDGVIGTEQSLDAMMDDSKEDQMDVSPVSPWRPMRHEEDEDDDADDSLDSGSDGAESSSPDPSMTDIIPMLDELHPLLHTENPGRGVADLDGSDAALEGPHRSSSDEGMESDVDSESNGEEGDNENEEEEEEEDEDEEEEEEEKKEEKDDESKSAIKWTEADQKNVMDLGTLELERNQRLENLIARRRARHNMRMMAEKNLIDFDSAEIPVNMPPISTARNPFDLPYDPYDDMDIPGSAPSIMFARKNPFDSPFDPNEEKTDVKGDGFEEELSSQQPKDQVFRRHESFSVGPSMLGGPRHDRLRPFFVLERLANEGTSYYPYERQLSEVSESKVSSVPDTESVCTILEDDEKKVDEQDADRDTEKASDRDEEKMHSASDHDDEEKSHSGSDRDEDKSHTSEDSDSDEQGDSRNLHHDVAEIVLGSPEANHEESNVTDGETSDKSKHDNEEDSSDSDSSLSETEEEIGDVSENEATMVSEQKVDLHEESEASSFGGLEIHVPRGVDDDDYHHDHDVAPAFITARPSLEDLAAHDLSVDDHHVEPVYDTSPRSGSRFPSFSSVSSDYKPDLPEKSVEEVQENADNEGENAEIHSTPDETERSTREVGESSSHVTGEANLHTGEVGGVEGHEDLHEEVKEVSSGMLEQHLPVEHTSSPDVVQDIAETSVNRSVSEGIMHEEQDKQKAEAILQTFNADIPIDSYSTLSSGAVEYAETHSFNDEDVQQSEQDSVQSSVSDAKEETHPNQTMDIEVDSVNASVQNVGSEETTPYESDRELTWSDKSVVEQSSPGPGEDQAPARAAPVSVVFSRNITFHEYHDAPEDTADLSCLTSDTSSSPAESPEYKTPMVGEGSRAEFFQETVYDELDHVVERLDQLTDLHAISETPPEVINEEADEIKEIDEGLLSELDTIGDFSVKEVVTDSEPGPSSIGSETANELTEALPVLEARSVEDIESAFQQINEGSEVEDVILPSTVQDQLAQENYGTESDLTVVEATSKDDLDTAMNQAVEESMGKQPKSPEPEGGSGDVKSAVETESSGSSVEERSLDETNVHLNNTPVKEEKKEEEESRLKEEGTTSDVSSIETRSLEEIPKPSEPKEEMAMEVISERVVNPTENVTVSDEVVTEEAKAETSSNADAITVCSVLRGARRSR